MKRIIALALALVLMFALAACGTPATDGDTDAQVENQSGTVLNPEDVVSIITMSHPSWPYSDDLPAWKYIREELGGNIQVTAVPNTDVATKYSLIFASPETMPDLMFADGKHFADSYSDSGALVAIDDHLDEMPNYVAFWDSLDPTDKEARLMRVRSADGKIYHSPNYGTDSRQGIRSWLYRKDVFEKNNLPVPTTMEEVYEVSLKLKELYPDSYPICLREGLRNIGVIGAAYKNDFCYGTYYDFTAKKWCYGTVDPIMKDMVEYMRKCYEAGLLPPDYLKIATKSWEELMSTDRGFILPDFVVRVDNFNNPNREQNPEYTLAAMVPPKGDVAGGRSRMNKFNVDSKGYMVCNTGDSARISNAIKVLDWFYSDEACELTGWGKEGETYQVVDGKKEFIRPADGDIEAKYGLFQYGTYLRVSDEAAFGMASPEQQAAIRLALDNTEEFYNPIYWLAFEKEDKDLLTGYTDTLTTYVEETLAKFLYLQKDMSEWDAFVAQIKEYGVDDMLAIYDRTYSKLTAE